MLFIHPWDWLLANIPVTSKCWCSTGTFGSVYHARDAYGQDVAIEVLKLSTHNQPGFSTAMRRCSAESELLQQIPSSVGLVHWVGQMFTMETASTPFYAAMRRCSTCYSRFHPTWVLFMGRSQRLPWRRLVHCSMWPSPWFFSRTYHLRYAFVEVLVFNLCYFVRWCVALTFEWQSYFHSMDMAAIKRYMLALCRSVSELHKLGLAHRYMFRANLLKCMWNKNTLILLFFVSFDF